MKKYGQREHTVDRGMENKARRRKERERRGDCERKNVWLSHCPSNCACARILSRVFVRSVWQSCSHFPSGAERYRKAGWLAGCTGKETVSIKQQMEDSMCLHCRNTHTRMHAGAAHMQSSTHGELCANTVAFMKSVTQIALWRI